MANWDKKIPPIKGNQAIINKTERSEDIMFEKRGNPKAVLPIRKNPIRTNQNSACVLKGNSMPDVYLDKNGVEHKIIKAKYSFYDKNGNLLFEKTIVYN